MQQAHALDAEWEQQQPCMAREASKLPSASRPASRPACVGITQTRMCEPMHVCMLAQPMHACKHCSEPTHRCACFLGRCMATALLLHCLLLTCNAAHAAQENRRIHRRAPTHACLLPRLLHCCCCCSSATQPIHALFQTSRQVCALACMLPSNPFFSAAPAHLQRSPC